MKLILASITIALLFAPLTSAQSPDAPHPSAEFSTLFAHGTGSDEANGFMNALEEDGGDNAMGASGSCQTQTNVGAIDDLTASAIERHWKFTLEPGLVSGLLLDAAGTMTAIAHIGSGSCNGKSVDVTAKLTNGGRTIAEGGPVKHSWSRGAPYGAVSIPMSISSTQIAAGEPLVWQIDAVGQGHSVMFLGVSDEQGHTRLEMPILSVLGETGEAAANVVHTDLTTADVNLTLVFDESTDAVRTYNWTNSFDPARVAIAIAGQGDVQFRVANATFEHLNMSYQGTNAAENDVAGALGAWQLRLDLTGFNGTIKLSVKDGSVEAAPAPSGGGKPAETPAGNPNEGDEEGSEGGAPVEDTPGLGIVPVLLCAFALALRRK